MQLAEVKENSLPTSSQVEVEFRTNLYGYKRKCDKTKLQPSVASPKNLKAYYLAALGKGKIEIP